MTDAPITMLPRAPMRRSHAAPPPAYAELEALSNFTFLEGGSHPHELVAQAKALGLAAIAICDRNSLAGIVRAHLAAKDAGLRLLVGARLDLTDAPSLICLPTDREAYGRLSSLLSLGSLRAPKGECHLARADVAVHREGQIFIVLPPDDWDWRTGHVAFATDVARLRTELDGARLYLAAHSGYRGDDGARLAALARLAGEIGVPLVATGRVLYHAPHRRALQDVLTAIRHGTTVAAAGFRLEANAERHLKAPREMARLFASCPDVLARTIEIADACRFSLDELVYEYPEEPIPSGLSPQAHLEALTWEGAARRFPDGVPDKVRAAIVKELALIEDLKYAQYFLTVHDIVAFARARGILCQGRGSAANSAVCYCLAITAVNPAEVDLLFERFISPERKEPPDIDVDFEHERREEVIQYIYARYGRDRAGLAATVISYRARSAVREVGKALGLSLDTVAALAGTVWGSWASNGLPEKYIRQAGFDPTDARLAAVLALADELIGFPRHLSQHVGGFVLTRRKLTEVVPVTNAAMEDRTFIVWDKDDLDALGLLKVDVLALGMLSCIRRAFGFLESHHDRPMSLARVPREDPAVYDMLCRADSLGVFQVESRAQMNMLPRLKPRCYYDLVIEVAIVRPGPIQGDMVHPYLRRRDGLEPEVYPAPAPEHGPMDELRQILGKTKGVPLFQEQAMRIAMDAAKFNSAEINELRRALATFRKRGTIHLLEEKMISRMVDRGYHPEFAARCFNQIKGFGEYGFPESHAASFAHLVYVSSWLKCHYPAAFCAAILNSQPMGFYAPAQLVRDAREHGVEVRPPDVNLSDWDCTLETTAEGPAVRLGLRQIDGVGEEDMRRLVALREASSFRTVAELAARAGMRPAILEKLAAADAFRSLGLDRRGALWAIKGLDPVDALPLFAWSHTAESGTDAAVTLPDMALSEHVVADYQTLKLSLKAHPMSFLRAALDRARVVRCARLREMKSGAFVAVAGVVLVRQRPGSAKGVVFMTLEDETGIANIVVWPNMLERFRKVVMGARLMVVKGRIQRHEDIIHVVASAIEDESDRLGTLLDTATPDAMAAVTLPIAHADEVRRPEPGNRARVPPSRLSGHPRMTTVIPKDLVADTADLARTAEPTSEPSSSSHDLDDKKSPGHLATGRHLHILPKSRDFH
jgi:error-prone DNA polymerase